MIKVIRRIIMYKFHSVMTISDDKILSRISCNSNKPLRDLLPEVSDINIHHILILTIKDEYKYIDLDKYIRDNDILDRSIVDITSNINDVLLSYVPTYSYPKLDKYISTCRLGDLIKENTEIDFTSMNSSNSTKSLADKSTPDLRIKLQGLDHNKLIPVYKDKIRFNHSPVDTYMVISDVKQHLVDENLNRLEIDDLWFIDYTCMNNVKRILLNRYPNDVSNDKYHVDIDMTNHVYKDTQLIVDGHMIPKYIYSVSDTGVSVDIVDIRMMLGDIDIQDVEVHIILLSDKIYTEYRTCMYTDISCMIDDDISKLQGCMLVNNGTPHISVLFKSELDDPSNDTLYKDHISNDKEDDIDNYIRMYPHDPTNIHILGLDMSNKRDIIPLYEEDIYDHIEHDRSEGIKLTKWWVV